MQFVYPTQNIYNDPYQQRRTNYGTIYPSKYLSKASNDILRAFSNNIVIKGLTVTPSFIGSNITLQFTPGIVVHDSTLINLTSTITITCDVSSVGDTPTSNSYLAVFTNFKYIETPDSNSQTPLSMTVYHINSSRIATPFSGSPAFSSIKNTLMVTFLSFTKQIPTGEVIACNEVPTTLTNRQPTPLTVNGTVYYPRGFSRAGLNSWDFFDTMYNGGFLNEFAFHDNT